MSDLNRNVMVLLVSLVDTDADQKASAEKLEQFGPLKSLITTVGLSGMMSKKDDSMFLTMLKGLTSGPEMQSQYEELTTHLDAIVKECAGSGVTPMDIENMRLLTTGIAMIDMICLAMRKEIADA
jgi:hypothetical protein